jgi:ribonuclease HI
MKEVTIYTDGACSGNPGKGGFGAYLIYKDVTKKIAGYEEFTTNNRMELKGAIEGLKCLQEKCNVTIYTDSMYLKNGITIWIHKWLQNDWNKGKIKNVDLWMELYALVNFHNVEWHWVKGHDTNAGNIIADELARNAIR